MHPRFIQDHPGTCPICGMDLVQMSDVHPHHTPGVHLDTASLQRLGVRLATARWQMMSRDIVTYGTIAVSEGQEFNVTAKLDGTIRRLHVTAAGQPVKAGDELYEIYSPELLQTQREYIALLREKDAIVLNMTRTEGHSATKGMSAEDIEMIAKSTNERMRAREKLLYADVGEELLQELERTYKPRDVVPVRAVKSGFVTRIQVREGSMVKAMDNVLVLTNLSQVRIDVPLYPDQLAWVKAGDRASINLAPYSSDELSGRIELFDPVLNETTHTARARIVLSNLKRPLRVGSFVDVTIHAQPHRALTVPRSAVMRTGKGDLVMQAWDGEHFAPAKVQIGIETADLTEIIAGLEAGDQVAVNGQFLLDAAASLSDAAERAGVQAPPATQSRESRQ
jgi:Cu(I)/Ag(I) efflux system membrane fusion protein